MFAEVYCGSWDSRLGLPHGYISGHLDADIKRHSDGTAAEVKRILALPDVKANLDAVGGIPAATTPAEFGDFLTQEHARWEVVIKGLGLLHSN